jgi:dihydroorotate dehydrogenase electron transfer subunit
VLRLAAPGIAARARPGQFVHLECGEPLRLRRPLSVLRAGTGEGGGWIELLYKVAGPGTAALARQGVGAKLRALGPAGVPFVTHAHRPRALLLGGGVGMPPILFLAERLARTSQQPLVLLGSEVPFPFRARPSTLLVPGIPEGVIATMPLLEDWGVPARLASGRSRPGCFEGHVTDLATHWLAALPEGERDRVALYACGPAPMLRAAAALAGRFGIPGQLCVEEYMACAVGGCAGCVVPVHTAAGMTLRRVCVDGPVFTAAQLHPEFYTRAADAPAH